MMKSSSVLNSGDGNKKTVDNATPNSLYISPAVIYPYQTKLQYYFFLFYSSKLNIAQYSSKHYKKFMNSTAQPAQTPVFYTVGL